MKWTFQINLLSDIIFVLLQYLIHLLQKVKQKFVLILVVCELSTTNVCLQVFHKSWNQEDHSKRIRQHHHCILVIPSVKEGCMLFNGRSFLKKSKINDIKLKKGTFYNMWIFITFELLEFLMNFTTLYQWLEGASLQKCICYVPLFVK